MTAVIGIAIMCSFVVQDAAETIDLSGHHLQLSKLLLSDNFIVAIRGGQRLEAISDRESGDSAKAAIARIGAHIRALDDERQKLLLMSMVSGLASFAAAQQGPLIEAIAGSRENKGEYRALLAAIGRGALLSESEYLSLALEIERSTLPDSAIISAALMNCRGYDHGLAAVVLRSWNTPELHEETKLYVSAMRPRSWLYESLGDQTGRDLRAGLARAKREGGLSLDTIAGLMCLANAVSPDAPRGDVVMPLLELQELSITLGDALMLFETTAVLCNQDGRNAADHALLMCRKWKELTANVNAIPFGMSAVVAADLFVTAKNPLIPELVRIAENAEWSVDVRMAAVSLLGSCGPRCEQYAKRLCSIILDDGNPYELRVLVGYALHETVTVGNSRSVLNAAMSLEDTQLKERLRMAVKVVLERQ